MEIALRQLHALEEASDFSQALTDAASLAVEIANGRAARRNAAPLELALRHCDQWSELGTRLVRRRGQAALRASLLTKVDDPSCCASFQT